MLPLARRFRPHNFKTMVGQEGALRALINALDTKRLHQSYLFTGTRGVGKTTLARILAKCLNCEQGISSTPCEQCSACLSIAEGRFVDLMEIDAASKTKVEDTRELLDNVQYLPTRGRYKIYLIDEVHMLSGHSFNALLKTLEEPPAHVIFLLATTDPQKLPITILSRCLQFHLRPLPFEQIFSHLKFVLNKEQASFEENALRLLSQAADGSLRDALSLLDQALAYGQGRIETQFIRDMLGLSKPAELRKLMHAIVQGNTEEALKIIRHLKDTHTDFSNVLTEILTMIHHMSIAKEAPDVLDHSILEKDELVELAKLFSPDTLQLYYQIALGAQRDLPFAPSSLMGMEMMALRMIFFRPLDVQPYEQPQNKVNLASAKTVNTVSPVHINSKPVNANSNHDLNEEIKISNESSIGENNKRQEGIRLNGGISFNENKFNANNINTESENNWQGLISKLPLTGMVKLLAEHCSIEMWINDQIHLILDETKAPLLNKRNEERLNELLNQYFKRPIKLKIKNGKNQNQTPAFQNQRVLDEKLMVARKSIEENPVIKELMTTFEGSIEQVSVVDD